MSEPMEKELINIFLNAWNNAAAGVLNHPSQLSLIDSQDVIEESMFSAFAKLKSWPAGFITSCDTGLPGLVICLFKPEDISEIEQLTQEVNDGPPFVSLQRLLNQVFAEVEKLSQDNEPVRFKGVKYFDFNAEKSAQTSIVGDKVTIGTYSLSIGNAINSRILLFYAPNGVLPVKKETAPVKESSTNKPQPIFSSMSTPSPSINSNSEAPPENIKRLLDVELDLVVRFGVTNMPLADIVRMGTGSMLELDRAVDEPVDILVNGRPLARGEVVVIDGYYGVRIVEILSPAERALSFV